MINKKKYISLHRSRLEVIVFKTLSTLKRHNALTFDFTNSFLGRLGHFSFKWKSTSFKEVMPKFFSVDAY